MLLAAGCSENKFASFMGSGKHVPDETQVRTNNALTLPPDPQLRPPAGAQGAQNTTVAAQQPVYPSQQPVYQAQPPAYPTQQPTYPPQQPAYSAQPAYPSQQPPIYNTTQPGQYAANQAQPYSATQQPVPGTGQPQALTQQGQLPPANQAQDGQFMTFDQILAKWGVSK